MWKFFLWTKFSSPPPKIPLLKTCDDFHRGCGKKIRTAIAPAALFHISSYYYPCYYKNL